MKEEENNIFTIINKLDEILKRVKNIEHDIKYLKNGNDNMTSHISFIESVYDTIKNPLYFVMNKFKTVEKMPNISKSLTQ
jgi:hypothetical protein